MKILVCGFMGAGKTTFINNSGAPEVIDLDEYLLSNSEVRCFGTISEFIKVSGIDSFRHLEFVMLRDHLLFEKGDQMIGLGGGTLENQEVRDLIEISEDVKLVWLDTPFDTCFSRIEGDESRPLAASRTKEELLELYWSRLSHYQKADLVISVENIKKLQKFEDLKQALYT